MDNRYGHPLFTSDEIEEASRFMTNLALEPDIEDTDIDQKIENSIADTITSVIDDLIYETVFKDVKLVYGINAPMFANMLIVQNIWSTLYRDHIMDYLHNAGMLVREYNFILHPLTEILVDRLIPEEEVNVHFTRCFPPDKMWNESWDDITDKYKPLLSPYNGLEHLYLEIVNVTNIDFMIAHGSKRFSQDQIRDGVEFIKKGEPVNMVLKILPAKNFDGIFALLEDCYKYL